MDRNKIVPPKITRGHKSYIEDDGAANNPMSNSSLSIEHDEESFLQSQINAYEIEVNKSKSKTEAYEEALKLSKSKLTDLQLKLLSNEN